MVGERETGNETYTVNLLRGLAQQPPSTDHYLILSPHPERLNPAGDLPSQFQPVRVWPGASLLRIPVATPVVSWLKQVDVLHMTAYVAPPWAGRPVVVTIHDLSFLQYPNAFPWRVRTMLRTLVPRSVAAAARVIAVSDWTKQDLINRYGLSPDKIFVTHEAPGPGFGPIPDARDRVLPAGVREPFVLAVGNLEPRKNLRRLVEAFAILAGRGFPGSLVLVGKGSERSPEFVRQAQEQGLPSRVVLTGYVPESELTLLYNRAALFVYPSLYEGFGLPPLEAMACGCPVVSSNATAMPETLGDAALLVDPLSVSSLAEAMAAVLERPAVADGLREKGLRHASRFSWKTTAAQTREVYASVLSASKGKRAAQGTR